MTFDLFFKLYATVSTFLFLIWLVFTDPKQNHVGKEWLWPGGKYNIRMLLFNDEGAFRKYGKLILATMCLSTLLMIWLF